jgi:hypothetical protein
MQATAFMNQIRSNSNMSNALDKYISLSFNERDKALKNVYIYSFFKSFKSMYDLSEQGYNYFGAVPSNSYVFYGHKKLFYTFMDYNIHSPSMNIMSNMYMQRVLTLDPNSLNEIVKNDVWKESVNEAYPGGIYNPTYERILNALASIEGIEVSLLSHRNDIHKEASYNSLGSMALTSKSRPLLFSAEDDSVATVSNTASLTDHISKFWNTACFINLLEMPSAFSDISAGTPYTYIKLDLQSVSTVFAKIESITGLNQNTLYSSYGKVNSTKGGGNAFPDSPINPGPNSKGGGSPDSPSSGNNKPSNQNNQRGNNNNPQSKKINAKLKQMLINSSKQLGRSLTNPEALSFMHSASMAAFSHKLSKDRAKAVINEMKKLNVVEKTDNYSLETGFANMDKKTKTIKME